MFGVEQTTGFYQSVVSQSVDNHNCDLSSIVQSQYRRRPPLESRWIGMQTHCSRSPRDSLTSYCFFWRCFIFVRTSWISFLTSVDSHCLTSSPAVWITDRNRADSQSLHFPMKSGIFYFLVHVCSVVTQGTKSFTHHYITQGCLMKLKFVNFMLHKLRNIRCTVINVNKHVVSQIPQRFSARPAVSPASPLLARGGSRGGQEGPVPL